ncbi:MAG: pyruvate carboxylase subunit B, partial [Alphaproteobacteria bacterium]|nr:pyruvate carboxylase subunit B [Alphaproteobacteria bacterium]
MGRLIPICDETLRDAHQCLWGTRMTNEMMLPVCRLMDGIGFAAIDLIGGAIWDVSVRFLLEDPWERMRHVSRLITRTPLNAWIRGQSLWTFAVFPNDVVELAIERVAANGMRHVTLYDQFNDLKNVEVCINKAKAVGLRVFGALVFTWSPVHTDAYYAEKAAEYVRLGVDEIVLKDPSGMLSETRVATQVAAIRARIGAVPINIHSHCMTGRAPDVLLAGVESGADSVHTAISPLAHAASHPPTEWVCDQLASRGYATALDRKALEAMAAYFRYACQRWRKPRGAPVPFDAAVLEHQMPGGMISNLINQLRQNGIEHRLEEILAETARVRKDMGYAPVVSPTAQFMVTQAVLNVVQGERYRTVPDELRKYVLGYYGTPPAPIAEELLDRAVRKGDKFVEGRCGDLVPPALARLRQTRGPFANDDDLLQAAFYGDEILRPLFAARERADYTRHYDTFGRIDDALKAALK